MATSTELNLLTVKELGSLAKELGIAGWHEMRKEELVRALVPKSRTNAGKKLIGEQIDRNRSLAKSSSKKPTTVKKAAPHTVSAKSGDSKKADSTTKAKSSGKAASNTKSRAAAVDNRKETPRRRDTVGKSGTRNTISKEKLRLRRDISSPGATPGEDRLALLVRDPFWLQVFWKLNPKTVERAKVAMGHFWYTALPVLRLFRQESDGSAHPKRQIVRDVVIHGGVSNWYIDVTNPPSSFQVELGYLSREKKFYSLISSNSVMTPQRQIVDEFDQLDGNWRGVADDLGRIYKLSGGDAGNQDLRRVFEEQLHRSMSAPLLSRYRASKQAAGASEKTGRNFPFQVDADVIIHGKTDPSVQVTIRNETITTNSDGSFSVRFSLPEKRHVFPIEAEGSDGVEMQRVILTVERNTRTLETLFQEHTEDD